MVVVFFSVSYLLTFLYSSFEADFFPSALLLEAEIHASHNAMEKEMFDAFEDVQNNVYSELKVMQQNMDALLEAVSEENHASSRPSFLGLASQ